MLCELIELIYSSVCLQVLCGIICAIFLIFTIIAWVVLIRCLRYNRCEPF